MGRPRCDPIDLDATLARLAAGAPRPAVYRAYAETAARPYSRASWEALLRLGQASLAKPSEGRQRPNAGDGGPISDADPRSQARADAESDAFWEARLSVKPRVVTTESDNASLSVKGGSLFVHDGERRLRYDPGSRMPSAVVMAGWGGVISIEAIRFCGSHGIAIIALDWMRELMSVTPTRASASAAMLRAQAFADPLPIAVRIVQAKLASAAQAGAITTREAARFIHAAGRACSVQEAMIAEAQAARLAWPNPPALCWRVGSPRIPPQWKQPPPTRSRMIGEARSKRHATHPLNALLSACFSVTAGRLAVALAAHSAHPAIGYLHADNRGRFSLAYDAIEPLRPSIEKAVFDFVRKHQFSANDFVRVTRSRSSASKDGGSIRLGTNLMRAVIADCAPSRSVIDGAARAMIALVLASSERHTQPIDFVARHPISDPLFQDRAELIPSCIGRAAPGRRLQSRSRLLSERVDGKAD
jgi:CRISP-associated protein Cas1